MESKVKSKGYALILTFVKSVVSQSAHIVVSTSKTHQYVFTQQFAFRAQWFAQWAKLENSSKYSFVSKCCDRRHLCNNVTKNQLQKIFWHLRDEPTRDILFEPNIYAQFSR